MNALAADQGHAVAQTFLGIMHYQGDGGAQDFVEGRRVLGLAAAQGHAEALAWLGTMHYRGEGGPNEYPEARALLTRATEGGHLEATVTLGHMHFDGQGGPKCFFEARRLLAIAAGRGHPAAQFTYGGMLLNGDAKGLGNAIYCNVIMSRSYAAGGKNVIKALPAVVHSIDNGFIDIGNHARFHHPNPQLV